MRVILAFLILLSLVAKMSIAGIVVGALLEIELAPGQAVAHIKFDYLKHYGIGQF